MRFPDKASIGNYPTSIERNDSLESILGNRIRFFVKDESASDETGMGIKIRQLEYLFAAANKFGATHLIVDGVADSHCCAAISHYAPRYGLEAVVVVKEPKPAAPGATHQKTIDSGAEIIYLPNLPTEEPARTNDINDLKEKIAREYSARGKKPMIVPTGATNELTIFGSAEIAKEIEDYETAHAVKFDYIFMPVGTGGIIYGLEFWKREMKKQWEVIGVIIDDKQQQDYQSKFLQIGETLVSSGRISRKSLDAPLNLVEGSGQGYGVYSAEDIKQIAEIRQKTGVYFDPVYMHKCFNQIAKMIQNGIIGKGSDVLLIYTGKH